MQRPLLDAADGSNAADDDEKVTPMGVYQPPKSVCSLTPEERERIARSVRLVGEAFDWPNGVLAFRHRIRQLPQRRVRPEDEQRWYHSVYSLFVMVMVSWSLIGWLIRLGYTMVDGDMPMMAGWYEVAASGEASIASGLALTSIGPAAYWFGLWMFDKHPNVLSDAMFDVGFRCKDNMLAMEHASRLFTRLALFWAVLHACLGVGLQHAMGSASWNDTEPLGAVVFDAMVTWISYFYQYYSESLVVVYFAMVCRGVARRIKYYEHWISTATYDVQLAAARFKELVAKVHELAQMFRRLITPMALLIGISLCVFLLNIVVKDLGSKMVLRAEYMTGHLVVQIVLFLSAASVTSALENVIKVASRLPPRASAQESAYMNSLFLLWSSGGELGFYVFGIVINHRVLVRICYVVALLTSTLVQYHLSQDKDK